MYQTQKEKVVETEVSGTNQHLRIAEKMILIGKDTQK